MTPSSSHPRVKKYEGNNGITVLQQDNPHSRACCIGVWVTTGSRDERKGEEGLSHFLEHMLFKGTANRSAFEISQVIEKVGGSLDAFTTKEQICVYAQVLDDYKDLAFDVLCDMILNPTFPVDQLALERQVVLEEISDVMDAPDDFIHDLFASSVFPSHPLGKPILGTPTTVSKFNRNKLLRFVDRTFRGPNMLVSVYGKIDKRRLMRLCDRVFRIPTGSVKRSNHKRIKTEPTRRLYKRKLHNQHICIGGPACSYLDERRYPTLLLTTILGGGMSSRLFQRIREELGYAYSVFTYGESARDTGIVGTYMAVKPSNAGAAVREVFKEFDRVRAGNLTAEELEDTKRQLKGKILLGLETSAAKMMRIARNEIYYGRQITERELINKIDRVTMDDVMAIADDVLNKEKNTIVSLGPSSAGLGH